MNVNEIGTTDSRWYERLRLAGLIVGLVWAGSGLLNGLTLLIPVTIISYRASIAGYLPIIIMSLVVFILVALAWRRPFIGGVALIVVWLLYTVRTIVLSLNDTRIIVEIGIWLIWVVPMIFGLLLPISGVLFLLASRKSQTIADDTTAETIISSKLHLSAVIVGLMAGFMYTQRYSASFFYLIFLGAGLIITSSVYLAWKKPFIGGALLIVEGLWPLVLLAVSPLFPNSEALGLAMMWGLMPALAPALCLPLLVSGILFILVAKKDQKLPKLETD